jgi:hypothetical protein
MTVVEDGKNDKITVTTKGGVVTTVDGTGKKVSIKAGETEIIIDGTTGKISLKGALVDLGTNVADFVTQFTQLAAAFNSHSHAYTDDGNPAVTTPPLAPLLVSVGSQSVKVQP